MSKLGDIVCCLNCEDRYVGCHGKCEKYIVERKARDEYVGMVIHGRKEQWAGVSEHTLNHHHHRGKVYKKGQP